MKILAIETSCDDTGIAVIKTSDNKKPCFDILSNIISSQVKIHQKYGGVYPILAKREHQKNLVPVLKKALKEAKLLKPSIHQHRIISKDEKMKKILEREEVLSKKLEGFFKKYQKPKVDVIAVTKGPGLEPCLWAGVNLANALAYWWRIPIIAVNHIEAHILANLIDKTILFPAICLVVSGGHTQLVLMKKINSYKIIGETRDDAAGECFDKTARILGLGYPGGPAIATKASILKKSSIKLPRPMMHTKDYDFSFSGLKTAVLYDFKKQSKKVRASQKYIREMSFEIQQSIIDVLIKKTIKAAKNYKAKSIILGGGVVANKELRKQFQKKIEKLDFNFQFPSSVFCTDNAAMIGITAYFHKKQTRKRRIKAKANLRIK